jgi:hypothetical protein
MSLKSLFVDNVRTTLFTLLSRIMNRSFQPAITAVLLSAALVLLAALPSSAGIGDGRHLVRNLSNNGANNYSPQIFGSNVVWMGDGDGVNQPQSSPCGLFAGTRAANRPELENARSFFLYLLYDPFPPAM